MQQGGLFMAHLTKFNKGGGIGHLIAHFERRQDQQGNYVNFGNQDIDTTKTHLNYNLADNYMSAEEVLKRCREHCSKKIRDNMNIMCSWVITIPEILKDKERYHKFFFEQAYKFLEERYGKDNVISAYVHFDETTPHMHFAFTPITKDGRLSAKEVVNRLDLQSFHYDLSKHMQEYFKADIGILNENTKLGNKTTRELKINSTLEKLTTIALEREEVKNDINILLSQKRALLGEIDALKGILKGNELTIRKMEDIKPQKTITGAIKGVSLEDIENLKKTAISSSLLANKLEDENNRLKELLNKKSREVEYLQNKIPSINEQMKAAKEKKELLEIKNAFEKLPDEIKTKLLRVSVKEQDKGISI